MPRVCRVDVDWTSGVLVEVIVKVIQRSTSDTDVMILLPGDHGDPDHSSEIPGGQDYMNTDDPD